MNKKKLKNIKLKASIDTLSIVSPEVSAKQPETADYINETKVIQNSKSDITRFQYIINPNKTESGEVYHYTIFVKVMEGILSDMEITQYYRNRVDFRVDSYQDNYNELLKLNKCIILLLSLRYKVKNRYQSFDPLSLDSLTIRIQNKYFEAENYNKAIEEPEGEVKNRLELRSKYIKRNKDIPALVNDWSIKLDSLVDYYGELQSRCNQELLRRWYLEKGTQVKSVSEFVRKYQDNIFCRKQLISFYNMVGVANPFKAADNFKAKNKIEFFSLNDIKHYLKVVSNALQNYC